MAKKNNDNKTEEENTNLVNEEKKVIVKNNRKVKLISRLDFPVTIDYGNSKKRLSPRHNEILEFNKLPQDLPVGIKLIEIEGV